MGVARFMRRAKPSVRIVAAEPVQGAGVPGLRSLQDGFVPEILDLSLIDKIYIVSKAEAIAGVRALLTHEGMFAGPSSGAILVAARRLAREMPGATIVALLPDGGWKYLSAGTFSRDFDEMADDLEGGVSWW
jgi:cysteine synthase B